MIAAITAVISGALTTFLPRYVDIFMPIIRNLLQGIGVSRNDNAKMAEIAAVVTRIAEKYAAALDSLRQSAADDSALEAVYTSFQLELTRVLRDKGLLQVAK